MIGTQLEMIDEKVYKQIRETTGLVTLNGKVLKKGEMSHPFKLSTTSV